MLIRRLLAAGAIIELATAAALLVAPALFAQILLGTEADATARDVARLAAVALASLALACWPERDAAGRGAYRGLLAYNAAVAVFLAVIGSRGRFGPLLWPAVALHAGLAAALAFSGRRRATADPGR